MKNKFNSEKGFWSFWLIILTTIVVSTLSFGIGVGLSLYKHITEGLPSVESLKNYRPPVVTTLYASDGSIIAEFYHERRYLIPVKELPSHVIQAFIAVEDSRFYEHKGVDLLSVLRAAIANIRAGTIVQGGSTITQQVAKSLLLTPERTWERKIKEAILAYKIDNFLSKEEILHLYLNQVYFGAGAYGIESAARTFFGKSAKDLTIAEAAMIAGLPKAPSKFNPYENFEEARKRQLYVIQRMEEEHFISKEQAEEARREPIKLKGRLSWKMNYFIEEVRRRMVERYGEQLFYEGGLHIYTTMDIEAQKLAEKTLLWGLSEYEKRHGFYGPIKIIHKTKWNEFVQELRRNQEAPEEGLLLTGLVMAQDDKKRAFLVSLGSEEFYLTQEGWSWTKKSYSSMKNLLPPGSVIKCSIHDQGGSKILKLEPEIEVEGAFVLANLKNGDVLALVGGKDFNASQFNRATQARRQPGSAFKPIVYATAVDKGFTEVTTVIDSPISYKAGGGNIWRPGNYDGNYMGPMTLRKALALSRNVVAVKLMDAVGVEEVIQMARKLGIESPLTPTLPLALGASGLPLIELAQAYSAFANNGYLIPFRMVTKVIDKDGKVLEEFPVVQKEAISPETAYIMTDMMTAVIKEGTGKYAASLGRPVAGKTGTSNEFRDAWFIGYTPDFIAGVWVGYDDNTKSLGSGETGGKNACPIWTEFMREWLKDKPVTTFNPPPGIVFMKVTVGSSVDGEERVAYLPFKADALPGSKSHLEEYIHSSDSSEEDSSEGEQSIYKSGLF